MIDFTVKDIEDTFQVEKPKARAILKVCKLWLRCSWSVQQDCIEWLDKACGTFGLEHLCEESQAYPDYNDELDFDYLNAGDTYAGTLIFQAPEYGPRVVLLSTWGDMLENYDRDLYEELDSPRACVCPSCNHHSFYQDQGASRRLESLKDELPCPNCLKSVHF